MFRRDMMLILIAALSILAVACSDGGSDANSGLATPSATGGELKAPEFPTGFTWFNVKHPLTMAELRGKVVVLDFWTLGCINCQHIVPDLNRLESEFGDAIAVIGVHSGKYDREHADDSVREATIRLGLDHPVVNDPDFTIWTAYGASAWPTIVVVDPSGDIAGVHEGEGVYDAVEPAVKQIVEDFDAQGQVTRTPLPIDLEAAPIASDFLGFPGTVLADAAHNRLFIADSGNNRILVSDMNGALQKAIGSGQQGLQDGASDTAEFNQPQGLALSADGATLYVADTRNHALRSVDLSSGEVTTLAGDGARATTVPDQPTDGKQAELASPWGLQLIGNSLFIAMAGLHQLWLYETSSGQIAHFLGSGMEGVSDGTGPSEPSLAQPNQITTDGSYLYWVDPESSAVRRYDLVTKTLKTLAGTGLFDFGDRDGPPTGPNRALLQHPQGIAYVNGTLYVADTYNHKLRTVDPQSGVVTTVAGDSRPGEGDGPAASATFNEPQGLSLANGKLYIADTNNSAVRVLDLSNGNISTLTLSNLSVATGAMRGRTLKYSLDPQTINAGTTSLHIKLSVPDGYQFNNIADSQLTFSVSDENVLIPGEPTTHFTTDQTLVDLNVPISVSQGQVIVSAAGPVYYCRENENAICLVDQVDIALPLTVTADAPAGDAVMQYELPQ
jgi:DNA-binding beta-propeller fold protein YncE